MVLIFASRLKKTGPLPLSGAIYIRSRRTKMILRAQGLIMLIIQRIARDTKMRRSLSQCDSARLFTTRFICEDSQRVDIPAFFS